MSFEMTSSLKTDAAIGYHKFILPELNKEA